MIHKLVALVTHKKRPPNKLKHACERTSRICVDRNKFFVVQGFCVIIAHVFKFITNFM